MEKLHKLFREEISRTINKRLNEIELANKNSTSNQPSSILRLVVYAKLRSIIISETHI